VHFLKSLTCLCTDIQTIPISVILSNKEEVTLLNLRLGQETQCGNNFQQYNSHTVANLSKPPLLEIVNLYDILPTSIRAMTSENTLDLLQAFGPLGKYKYQSLKKLAAAAFYDYDYGIWLDSEGFALRPFSMSAIISRYMEHPLIFRSAMNDNRQSENMQAVMETAASILGRTMDSYGKRYWNLER
jgi:hypothetical protein